MILDHLYNPMIFCLKQNYKKNCFIAEYLCFNHIRRSLTEYFLEKKKNKGYFIPIPTLEDSKNIFFTREIIEGKTAAATVLNDSNSEILELKELLQKQENSIENTEKNQKLIT